MGMRAMATSCRNAAPDQLQDCGPVPELAGLEGWINTDQPVDPGNPARVNSKQQVTLVDFWAYACINCQRANEHVTALYDHYRDSGLQVLGVHAPEYAFEREAANVQSAVRDQHIHYPVAQDNNFLTWNAFNNRYWPAHYLVDHTGQVRQIHEGEGAYAETEQLVRQLLEAANPGIALPAPLSSSGSFSDDDATSPSSQSLPRNPETYLGVERAQYFSNPAGEYTAGEHDFAKVDPAELHYSLEGPWVLDRQSIRTGGDGKESVGDGKGSVGDGKRSVLRLNYRAARVQLVVSGRGEVQVTFGDGSTKTFPVRSDGTIDLFEEDTQQLGELALRVTGDVELYSFTFG